MIFGGSWGSTLALAYAESHADRVSEMVLRGIFLVRRKDIEWFYEPTGGAAAVFPDAFHDYVEPIPPHERHPSIIHAYHRRLVTGDNEEERLRAARAWSIWEGRTSRLNVDPATVLRFAADAFSIALARIECHYFVNNGFLKWDSQLLDGVDKIRHIPTYIIHGRYDLICPASTAWELHRAFPEAHLRIVPNAGHSSFEPGITHELILATDAFRR
mmetsp:Transcript_2711/g.4887  ORF Transcript_2711/g.4887 Transcript_2711/m.4887 type:complete len:215 (-) Transcript_2711:782-1426(-)